jgi:hypothetical protein
MDTNNEATSTYLDEDTPILPDGWADGDDLFTDSDSDDAAEVDTAAEPGATDTGVAENAADTDGLPTTESGEDAAQDAETDTETTDTTESGASQAEETMLRFKALVDHEDIDVELKESELPTIYQKARVTDRVQQRLAEMTPTVETAARLARQMGYDSPQDMLNAAAQNYHDSEIEKLTSEGVHPEVARDIVERRMQDAAVPVQRAESSEPAAQAETAAQRDYQAEVEELLQARPQLRGQALPDAVSRAAVEGDKRLLLAYLDYEAQQAQAENERLRKENEIYKQNAATAARSPVRGVSGGGATDLKPSDPFLDGFNAADW